jgi:major membrane immunogen (membrane-anchored lipoprotein)
MKKIGLVMAMAIFIVLSSCKKEEEYIYENGDYSAEDADFHYGWKAFMEVEISDDAQISVTFDYTDEDGNLKTATTDDAYPMTPHPRVWCPELETQLMAVDIVNFDDVDGVSGATGGSVEANELFALILEAAKTGDTSTQVLPVE